MEVSNIYTDTLDALRAGQRRIIHQGGQYSGKTVNILGALATAASEDEEPGVTTVTSMSLPHLRGGALRDFQSYVLPTFTPAIRDYNKTNNIYTFKNGSIFEFKAFDSEMKGRGGKRKRLFINEVNSFGEKLYFQLDSRSEQTIVDYNPSVRFFIHEIHKDYGNLLLLSDHRNNPFLTFEKHQEIENIKDPELWKVYARGMTGNVKGVIFPDWKMIDDENYPWNEEQYYSIDFGYTVDPTAIIQHCRIGDSLFLRELCYEPGLAPKSIKNILAAAGFFSQPDRPFFCEHDPDMIKQLRDIGITGASPARKGQGSVNAGIELLKQFNVHYTASSKNMHRELGKYIWMEDKTTGKTLNIPVDNNNHTLDATRYGVYTIHLRKK